MTSPVSPSDRVHEDPQLLELRRELEEARKALGEMQLFRNPDEDPVEFHAMLMRHATGTEAETASEASLALAVRALEPFAAAFQRRVENPRHAQVRRDWYAKMPGEWPITLQVTMADGRAARLALIQIKGEGREVP